MERTKDEMFVSAREVLRERIEDWMDAEGRRELIAKTIVEIIDYYDACGFYLNNEEGLFLLDASSGEIIPHQADKESACKKTLISARPFISPEKSKFNPSFKSEMCIPLFDEQAEAPVISMLFYAASKKEGAFSDEDIEFIKDLADEFL